MKAAVATAVTAVVVASVSEHLREGSKKIVYDKFHIAKHLGEAVEAAAWYLATDSFRFAGLAGTLRAD